MKRFIHQSLLSLARASGVAGVVGIFYLYDDKPDISHLFKPVKASWTTGYVPPKESRWDNNWDKRDPIALKQQLQLTGHGKIDFVDNQIGEPKGDRHILLIRHGQYNDDALTDKERNLTDLGKAQAATVGRRLRSLSLPYSSLTASTMARATETAAIINEALPELTLQTDDALREGCPAEPAPPVPTWQPEKWQFHQDSARIEAAFRKYFHRADAAQAQDSYEIVVCHANVIRYFLCRALQLPAHAWLRLCLANCSITLITIGADGHVHLEMMGDHGFFQHDHISF